jgi:hypothetical protein
MKKFHIRGNKEVKAQKILELMKNEDWLDAHRYTDSERIEQGLIGKLGDIEYYNN